MQVCDLAFCAERHSGSECSAGPEDLIGPGIDALSRLIEGTRQSNDEEDLEHCRLSRWATFSGESENFFQAAATVDRGQPVRHHNASPESASGCDPGKLSSLASHASARSIVELHQISILLFPLRISAQQFHASCDPGPPVAVLVPWTIDFTFIESLLAGVPTICPIDVAKIQLAIGVTRLFSNWIAAGKLASASLPQVIPRAPS